MLLRERLTASLVEFQAVQSALEAGVRADSRKFDESRELKILTSNNPGFALVQFGKTMVTSRTTAKLFVPNSYSPNKGSHYVKVFAPPTIPKQCIDSFQTYFRMIWKSMNIVEEETLCVKNGEKAWLLTSEIVINDDDACVFDAALIALYVSLSQIKFPSFDPATGNLYPLSQRRAHRIAFSQKPISVTIAFFNDEMIVDPTLLEMQMAKRYAVFVFSEHFQQIYVDMKRPKSVEKIDEARNLAIRIAKERKVIIDKAVDSFKNEFSCVGASADFIGYEPLDVILPKSHKGNQNFAEFKVWYGTTHEKFIIDFFKIIDSSKPEAGNHTEPEEENWLLSSLA